MVHLIIPRDSSAALEKRKEKRKKKKGKKEKKKRGEKRKEKERKKEKRGGGVSVLVEQLVYKRIKIFGSANVNVSISMSSNSSPFSEILIEWHVLTFMIGGYFWFQDPILTYFTPFRFFFFQVVLLLLLYLEGDFLKPVCRPRTLTSWKKPMTNETMMRG